MTCPVEGLCPRCGRLYFLEAVNDPGVCCICARDDRLCAAFGPDWRARVVRSKTVSELLQFEADGDTEALLERRA